MEKKEITCYCGVAQYIGNRWRGVTIRDKRRLICIKCRTILLDRGNTLPPED